MQTNSGSRNRYTGTLSKDFNKDVKATQRGNDSPFNKLGLNNGTTLFCKTKASTILWHYIKTLTISLWGLRIVWCTLTSWYLVSLLPVSIIHVSVILLVGFWSWEISFIMWGSRGWGWQVAGTWVSVSCEMVGFPAPIGWPGAIQSTCTQ